jgi:hypothetical protein
MFIKLVTTGCKIVEYLNNSKGHDPEVDDKISFETIEYQTGLLAPNVCLGRRRQNQIARWRINGVSGKSNSEINCNHFEIFIRQQ